MLSPEVVTIVASILGTLLSAVLTAISLFIRRVISDTAKIKTDMAVMKVRVNEALGIREGAKITYEKVIRLEEKHDLVKKDLNALHEAKRDIYRKLEAK
jgi:ribosome-associated protein YbcJ (S4-like RNA binding protein)